MNLESWIKSVSVRSRESDRSEAHEHGFCVTDSEGQRPHHNLPSRLSRSQLRKKSCGPIKGLQQRHWYSLQILEFVPCIAASSPIPVPVASDPPFKRLHLAFHTVLVTCLSFPHWFLGFAVPRLMTGPNIQRRAFSPDLVFYPSIFTPYVHFRLS